MQALHFAVLDCIESLALQALCSARDSAHGQDEATMTVSQILGTYRKPHDNLHQELEEEGSDRPVMDYTAHASLEKRRPLPELDESDNEWSST